MRPGEAAGLIFFALALIILGLLLGVVAVVGSWIGGQLR